MHTSKLILKTFVIASLTLPFSAFASSWSCSKGNDVREVHVVRTTSAPVPCEVVYKKLTEGVEDQVLWNANSQEGYCEEKASAFISKLEGWGWVCAETIAEEATPESSTGDETTESDSES